MEKGHVGLQRNKQAAGLPQPLRIGEGEDEGAVTPCLLRLQALKDKEQSLSRMEELAA